MNTLPQQTAVELTPAQAPSPSIADRAAGLAPYRNAAETIGAEDIAIPRMMVAQATSQAVQDGLVPVGAIYVASDANDPEPVVMHQPDAQTGVLVHPIALRKQWVYDEDGDFRVVDDLADDVPQDAARAYTYALLVPEYDPELPVSLMLKGTATQVAKKFNLAIKRAEPAPPWSVAFRLTTGTRQNDRGRWFVVQAASVAEADAKHVELASRLATMLGIAVDTRATGGGVVEHADESNDIPF
jgi:hypothetical protein